MGPNTCILNSPLRCISCTASYCWNSRCSMLRKCATRLRFPSAASSTFCSAACRSSRTSRSRGSTAPASLSARSDAAWRCRRVATAAAIFSSMRGSTFCSTCPSRLSFSISFSCSRTSFSHRLTSWRSRSSSSSKAPNCSPCCSMVSVMDGGRPSGPPLRETSISLASVAFTRPSFSAASTSFFRSVFSLFTSVSSAATSCSFLSSSTISAWCSLYVFFASCFTM
mmetsp:Transcript_31970/g.75933  ORF Transcript_31970/g.75933 Transcript_31970/m.75933 type:complete len:225 (-) Transcript_31970:814-1488(-)